jgi:hypothetical protein
MTTRASSRRMLSRQRKRGSIMIECCRLPGNICMALRTVVIKVACGMIGVLY